MVSQTAAPNCSTSETLKPPIHPMEEPFPRQTRRKAKPTQSKPSKSQQEGQIKAMQKFCLDIGTEPVIDTIDVEDERVMLDEVSEAILISETSDGPAMTLLKVLPNRAIAQLGSNNLKPHEDNQETVKLHCKQFG